MMEYLPPVGWGDLARHSDLAAVRAEIAQVRVELGSEIARLEGRMDARFHELRAEMHEGFGAVRTDFAAIIAAQTRSMVLMILGSLATITAIAFAAARAG